MKHYKQTLILSLLVSAASISFAGEISEIDEALSCAQTEVSLDIVENSLGELITTERSFLKTCKHQSGKESQNLALTLRFSLPLEKYAVVVLSPFQKVLEFGLTTQVNDQPEFRIENPDVSRALLSGERVTLELKDESGFSNTKVELKLKN